ncbi:hypothetical protein LY76DRAFT_609004 [Colletotrichum caudatum]|nr:hypothetical protein LY76DRAFT_609004 [Colletotrichum caudatum]
MEVKGIIQTPPQERGQRGSNWQARLGIQKDVFSFRSRNNYLAYIGYMAIINTYPTNRSFSSKNRTPTSHALPPPRSRLVIPRQMQADEHPRPLPEQRRVAEAPVVPAGLRALAFGAAPEGSGAEVQHVVAGLDAGVRGLEDLASRVASANEAGLEGLLSEKRAEGPAWGVESVEDQKSRNPK